jgi:hypothetical protein
MLRLVFMCPDLNAEVVVQIYVVDQYDPPSSDNFEETMLSFKYIVVTLFYEALILWVSCM